MICADEGEAVNFLKNSVSKHSKLNVVFSPKHGAIPVFDVTQPLMLGKNHGIGSAKEIVDLIHNSNPKAVASVANGRPVTYVFYLSPSESGFFIKK